MSRISSGSRPDRSPRARSIAFAVAAAVVLATAVGTTAAAAHVRAPGTPARRPGAGAAGPYPCASHSGGGVYGAFDDAAAIGWQGNAQGVVACLGGSFFVQGDVNTTYGFGVYDGSRTRWSNVAGYLPALQTRFRRFGVDISITNLADQVTIGGARYVAVYSRVSAHNRTARTVGVDPEPSAGLLPVNGAPNSVAPRATVAHDYVVAADRFGQAVPWPDPSALQAAGGFDAHFEHMRSFWDARLASIAQLSLPDPRLVDAYRSGYIDTQIARSGDHLNTGVNGYQSEYNHDVIGILANLFTQGDYGDAHALLLDARDVVAARGQYEDGVWTYSWPWAVYLLKTGDLGFVAANFSTGGPGGPSSPSIEQTAHRIAADRTGPDGIMRPTDDIDATGWWTVDNYEALMGLASYRYLAQRLGEAGETAWATSEYDSLLAATNRTLDATIRRDHLRYLPCSMVEPNPANRCADPKDANWAAPFLSGRWTWDGRLFGADVTGPGVDLIDATYDYGFGRLRGKLPPDTYGGYQDFEYSTGYNAGYGSWGLASQHHRDQGIRGYEFMISRTQSGPLSWWESNSAPNPATPWVGSHPQNGQGSSPHAWGMANANKVLLDSVVAQQSDGTLLVGRGVPTSWTRSALTIAVANFPTVDGRRIGLTISRHADDVTVRLTGDSPTGLVVLELPAFVGNLRRASAGTTDDRTGTVTLPAGVRHVTVQLAR